MEIKLTNKQYEKLVQLIYMGMWIVDFNNEESDKENYFSDIEQFIYSCSNQIPDQTLLEFDNVTKKYFPTINFDKGDIIASHIDSYEENCFWDELIDRLTKRDMINKYGLEGIHQMTQEEIFEKEKQFIQKYEEEFQKSGIDSIKI